MKKLSLLASCLLLFCACSQDSDYDFGSIDTTIGVTMSDLDVPQSSTSRIKLSQLLELGDGDAITFDSDSNYVFVQDGKEVNPEHPLVDIFTVSEKNSTGYDIVLSFPTAAPSQGQKAAPMGVQGGGEIRIYDYEGTKPKGVVSLDRLKTSSNIELRLLFPKGLSKVVPEADNISFYMPDFMTLSNVTCSTSTFVQDGNTLKFTNVPTDRDLVIKAKVTQLDLHKEANERGYLRETADKVQMEGIIIMEFSDASPNLANISQLESNIVKSDMSMSDFKITAATGRFSPDINISSIGKMELTDVPEFLTREGVVVDLDNICLYVDIANDMEIGGYISGSLTSTKGGKQVAKVEVPEFKVNAQGDTRICICRKATDALRAKYVCVEVPTLSTIIETFPDVIDFDVKARADKNVTATIELGKKYTIKPSYRVEAPVAFGEKASIVYEKDYDDWNEDLEDVELAQGTKVTIQAKALNTIPLNLKVKAVPIDKSGNPLTDITVDSQDVLVPASVDGKTPATADIKITILDASANALHRLDGMKLIITGSAKEQGGQTVTGVTLNGKTQYLEFREININIDGKVIYDAN